MSASNTRGVYLPQQIADELLAESKRTGLPRSELLQRAWVIARERMAALPGSPCPPPQAFPSLVEAVLRRRAS